MLIPGRAKRPWPLPEQQGERLHKASPAEHAHKGGPPKILPTRHGGEPRVDRLKLRFDDGEVGSSLNRPGAAWNVRSSDMPLGMPAGWLLDR